MMVKKFNEFIEEGFLSKTINRSKTGEIRLEKKLPSNNINQFKEIDLDLPIVFADKDLVINGKDKFTWEEVEDYKEGIHYLGWRLPTWDEVKKYFLKKKSASSYELQDDFNIKKEYDEYKGDILHIYKLKNQSNQLDIPITTLGQRYWADWSETFDEKLDEDTLKKRDTARAYVFYNPDYVHEKDIIFTTNEEKKNKIKVRLVKDK